jgi:hypothetical protein
MRAGEGSAGGERSGACTEERRGEHEIAWPQASELRADLDTTRRQLTDYAGLLAAACGVPDLRTAVPQPEPAP